MEQYGLQTLLASESASAALPCQGTPTTYFIDSDGHVLGYPVEGANTEKYRSELDKYLSELEE